MKAGAYIDVDEDHQGRPVRQPNGSWKMTGEQRRQLQAAINGDPDNLMYNVDGTMIVFRADLAREVADASTD